MGWVLCWAVLMGMGLVWTQLVWGPYWEAGADYGLSARVRVTLMAVAGAPLMLPFLVLNVVLDPVWFLYALALTLYGLVAGSTRLPIPAWFLWAAGGGQRCLDVHPGGGGQGDAQASRLEVHRCQVPI